MVKITKDEIRQLAYQVRLLFTADELKNVTEKINAELDGCTSLLEIDTNGVEPLFFGNRQTNVFREDIVSPSPAREESLKNAPKHDGECFLFPAVLG